MCSFYTPWKRWKSFSTFSGSIEMEYWRQMGQRNDKKKMRNGRKILKIIIFLANLKVINLIIFIRTKHFSKKVYRRKAILKFLLRKLNYSIYLANCFFQMLAVIFTWKPTGIVVLNFLQRTFESHKEKVLSLLFPKCWKRSRNLQSNAIILFSRRSRK